MDDILGAPIKSTIVDEDCVYDWDPPQVLVSEDEEVDQHEGAAEEVLNEQTGDNTEEPLHCEDTRQAMSVHHQPLLVNQGAP